MLVTKATGTGKTRMTVNEIYRLMKSGVARRVLFLVDRRALAVQTVREFASFEAEPGLKFDKIYPVYSQRLQKKNFDEDEKFDPNVMPNSLRGRRAERCASQVSEYSRSAARPECGFTHWPRSIDACAVAKYARASRLVRNVVGPLCHTLSIVR
jgi:hypothetical protein